ncbi:MAG: class I tRNA ligase family protein, partial [Candidatus Binatia bacterium]|nr:class I tRNA ligase family protein [Candidatus Binatia bacterium]
FNEFANNLYQFVWHEFCDWYIEMSKLSLNGTLGDDRLKTQRVLCRVHKNILLLLHPIMPFVSEEIWQVFASKEDVEQGATEKMNGSIMAQRYPEAANGWRDLQTELEVDSLIGIIRGIRNLRTELNCPPSREVSVILYASEDDLRFVRSQEPYLRTLARANSIDYLSDGEKPKRAATAVVGAVEIYLPIEDLVDLREERERLAKEVAKVEPELVRAQKKLSNKDFLAKAREEVIQKERDKAEQIKDKIRTLNCSLKRILEIQAEAGS